MEYGKHDVMELIGKIESMGVDLDRIHRITVIESIAVNTSPLRIGCGRGKDTLGSPVDLPVERLPGGKVYIPGSSLKGCLRSLAEKIVDNACNIFLTSRNPCSLAVKILAEIKEALQTRNEKDLEEKINKILGTTGEAPAVKEITSELRSILQGEGDSLSKANRIVSLLEKKNLPCPVCRIFGNTELAGHIEVHSFNPEGEPEIMYRTRVAIDRFREAARSGALFQYECVGPGTRWRGRIVIYNINIKADNTASKLLRSIIKVWATQGLMVGGMKSVGHGALVLEENSTIREYVVENLELKKKSIYAVKELLQA